MRSRPPSLRGAQVTPKPFPSEPEPSSTEEAVAGGIGHTSTRNKKLTAMSAHHKSLRAMEQAKFGGPRLTPKGAGAFVLGC